MHPLLTPPSLLHLLTAPTLSRELLMTHLEGSPIAVVMQRRRSLNLHSCAGASPPAANCHRDGYVDCHFVNGAVCGDEGGGSNSWDVLGWHSRGSATPEGDVGSKR